MESLELRYIIVYNLKLNNMIKKLETLLNKEQLAQLISAINENKDFSFD